MRRVPKFLPSSVQVWSKEYTGYSAMIPMGSVMVPNQRDVPTLMQLVLFQSPELIHGLLMTEVLVGSADDPHSKVERFFFGYRCSTCNTIFLVQRGVMTINELHHFLAHQCDPSDFRRAVRQARDIAREEDEHIMQSSDGRWWPEKDEDYHLRKQFIGSKIDFMKK